MAYINIEEHRFYTRKGILDIEAGEGVTIDKSDPRRPKISADGGGNTGPISFTDISGTAAVAQIPNLATSKITSGIFALARIPTGKTATTVALGNHTHHASEIEYDDTNVGTALANAIKNKDSAKELDNLTLTGNLTYKSKIEGTSATELNLGESNILVKSPQFIYNVSGEINFMNMGSTVVSMNVPLNIRGDLNFQGGAIANLMLWKNASGKITAIFNNDASDENMLRLPKDSGTLALLEDLPTGEENLVAGFNADGKLVAKAFTADMWSDFPNGAPTTGMWLAAYLPENPDEKLGFGQATVFPIAGQVPLYYTDGKLKVNDATEEDEAVNLKQLNAIKANVQDRIVVNGDISATNAELILSINNVEIVLQQKNLSDSQAMIRAKVGTETVDFRRVSIWGASGIETTTMDGQVINTTGTVYDTTMYDDSNEVPKLLLRENNNVWHISYFASGNGARTTMWAELIYKYIS